jgi:hypothetical protein
VTAVAVDEREEPEDQPNAVRRSWGYVRTSALLVVLADAVAADDVGGVVGAAVELGRRIQAGMVAEDGSGPTSQRVLP